MCDSFDTDTFHILAPDPGTAPGVSHQSAVDTWIDTVVDKVDYVQDMSYKYGC